MTASVIEKDMTVIEFFRVLRRYRWLLIGSTLSLMVLAGVYAALKTPLYSAKVVMIPAQAEGDTGLASRLAGSLGGLMSLANIDLNNGTGKEEAIAVLKSRRFTERFIADRNLLPELFPDLWDTAKRAWADPEEIPTMGSAFARFDQKIRFVSEDDETGLVTLEIVWHDRKRAAEWANDLVVRLNQRTRDIAIDESERSLRYLNEQLKKTDIVPLRQAMFGLIERHINRVMLAKIRDEYAFKVIDPAVAPDANNYVSPRPLLITAIAAVFGFMIGLALAFCHLFLKEAKGMSSRRTAASIGGI